MPRIAVVTPYFPMREQPYRGHSTYQTLRELRYLAEIEVYCPVASYPRMQWLQPRSYHFVPPDPAYSPPGMRTVYFEYPALPVLSRPFNGQTCARQLLPYLNKSRPDLILNYWLYPEGYAAVKVGKTLGIPTIVSAVGSDLRRIPDPVTLRLTRATLREAAFVITVSEELRRQALGLGVEPQRARAILNGCDASIFHLRDRVSTRCNLGFPQDAELVLFVGFLTAAKGVVELLDAIIQLAGARPRLQLAYIGEGPLQAKLERRARSAGLGDRVRFLGRCSSQRVACWMAAANVFCLPSHSEGCPNAIVEALSCGRPVVASNVGGIPELVASSSGILVPPKCPLRLAQALDQALSHSWDEAAISHGSGRGWKQVAQDTFEQCLHVLPGRTHMAVGSRRS